MPNVARELSANTSKKDTVLVDLAAPGSTRK
jgi:hypothetical protein